MSHRKGHSHTFIVSDRFIATIPYLRAMLSVVAFLLFCHTVTALPYDEFMRRQDNTYSWPHTTSWSAQSTTVTPTISTPATSTKTPTTTATPSPTAAPVIPKIFPDPSFLEYNGQYYAFATSNGKNKIQIAQSPSFTNPSWTVLDINLLPNPGVWTDGSADVWAPYVYRLDNGNFVLYYAGPGALGSKFHCVGAAISNSITGPYTPMKSPFACPLEQGGAIDPTVFSDPNTGNLYVIYKVDGNSLNTNNILHPTPLIAQQVSREDGITPIGAPVTLVDRDSRDGPLIEAPSMFYQNGMYYLLFSSNMYTGPNYDVRYAISKSVTGPFIQQDTPLISSGIGGLVSPGSACVDPYGGNIMFHATVGYTPDNLPIRYAWAGTVHGDGEKVVFDGFIEPHM